MNQSIIYILFGLLFTIVNGATFHGCSASQQSQLNAAASIAQRYATDAANYLNFHQPGTPRYTTWFGPFTPPRYNTVTGHFTHIARNNFESFTYDCSTCTKPGVYAYVHPNQIDLIYLCGRFWPAPMTGTDSKAGKIISMASQFTANGGTREVVHGENNCKRLAASNPEEAVNNADSYEYFAENNPYLP